MIQKSITGKIKCIFPSCTSEFEKRRGMKVHVGMEHDIESLLLEDINRVAESLGTTPHVTEYEELGKFNRRTVSRQFGDWNEALKEAGYEPTSTKSITDGSIKKYLGRVIENLGRAPTRFEFNDRAPVSATTVERRFGSWSAALDQFDVEPYLYKPEKDELLDEIRRLHEEYGRVTTPLMDEHGRFDSMTYIRRFGNWKTPVVEAGFEEPTRGLAGEDHPHWKGGTTDWRGSNWWRVREKVRERDSHECRVCEKPAHYERGNGHQVHHITPFDSYDDPLEANKMENLVLLCLPCHSRFEGRWEGLTHSLWAERARSQNIHQGGRA